MLPSSAKWIPALLLFAVCAVAQLPPPHPAWAGDQVHEIRLTFPNADWYEVLTANYAGTEANNPYFPAALDWGSYHFDTVGVRFKGNSSYRANGRKKPFRIKTNEFVKGQKIAGIGAYNLSNVWNDASFVRENVYYEMAAAVGLKAPRANYAALYINGEYWGLYVLGEVINEDFLQNHLGKDEDTGNLYKANIGAVFTYLGEDKARYKEVWEKQSNEDEDDWTDLITLCRLIAQTSATNLPAVLEPIMDIDSVLLGLALDNATVNLDSYVGMGQNFNIYRRPSDGKWMWLVWDPSLAFGGLSQGQTLDQMKTLSLEWVRAGGPGGGSTARPLASKLWAVPEYRERYRQIYQQLMDKAFRPADLTARMDTLRAMLRPFVAMGTKEFYSVNQFDQAMTVDASSGLGGPNGASPALEPFVVAREASIRTQLGSSGAPTVSAAVNAETIRLRQDVGAKAVSTTLNLALGGSALPISYSIRVTTASGGEWLEVNPSTGVGSAQLTVKAGEDELAAGTYTGALIISVPAAMNGSITVPVSLTVGSGAAPVVTSVVNSASYAAGGVSPGEIITIFGRDMGPTALAAGAFANAKWPVNVGGTQVSIGGIAAPVLYARNDQVSAVVPFGVGGMQTNLQVSYGGQTSAAMVLAVTAAHPGVFTVGSTGTGQAAVLNQDGTVNSTSAPAVRGSTVSVFLTGLGATNPAGQDGSAGPTNPLSWTVATVTATLGGQPVAVTYSGLAPGSVQGLYQVNLTIPGGVASGNAALVISAAGAASQGGTAVAVQ